MTDSDRIVPGSSALTHLARDVRAGRREALSSFWQWLERVGTPLIEPVADGNAAVTFVWRHDGKARSVAVIQDWGADGIREHLMSLLPDSDCWYLTRLMPMDTRTTYQLSPSKSDDPLATAPYRPDPLNRRTHVANLSTDAHRIVFSVLELPAAPAMPWRAVTAGGGQSPFRSEAGLRAWSYLPAEGRPDASLIVLDGSSYRELLHLPQLLDYLTEQKLIQPIAVLLVDRTDRAKVCDASFADRVAGLTAAFREEHELSPSAGDTFVAGSSYGGLDAAFLALTHPEIFGGALCQTGWFRWHPDEAEHNWLARRVPSLARAASRFWLQVGTLETARMRDGGPSQLEANRILRDALQAQGVHVSYEEYSGGHDASSIEAPLARALASMFELRSARTSRKRAGNNA